MKKLFALMLVLVVALSLFIVSASAASKVKLFNTINYSDIESIVSDYPLKVSAKKYTSTAQFATDAGITSTEGKGWVFLIDFDKHIIALSDTTNMYIIKMDKKGSLEYVTDISKLRTKLVNNINNYQQQAMQKNKMFTVLEARNAFSSNVSSDVANLADIYGVIDLSDSSLRSRLVSEWESDTSTASGLKELGNLLSQLDTNGNGKIDPEEIFAGP